MIAVSPRQADLEILPLDNGAESVVKWDVRRGRSRLQTQSLHLLGARELTRLMLTRAVTLMLEYLPHSLQLKVLAAQLQCQTRRIRNTLTPAMNAATNVVTKESLL